MVGCQDEKAQLRFIQQTGIKSVAEPVPSPTASPIRWLVAEDRIVLFLNDVGVFGATQSRLAIHRHQEIAYQASSEYANEELHRVRSHLGTSRRESHVDDLSDARRFESQSVSHAKHSASFGSSQLENERHTDATLATLPRRDQSIGNTSTETASRPRCPR